MNKDFRVIQLSEQERLTQRESLRTYMRQNPISLQPKPQFWHQLMKPVVGVMTILIVIGSLGSIGYAAEASLPGDVLYPVKVIVSEPLQGLLKVEPQTKLIWEIELTNKRLEEARQLIYQDRLEGKAEDALLASLAKGQKRLERAALRVSSTDGDELLDELDIRLQGIIHGETSIVSNIQTQSTAGRQHQSYIGSISSLHLSPISIGSGATAGQTTRKVSNESVDKRKAKLLQQISDVSAIQISVTATSSPDDPYYRQASESLDQARQKIEKANEAMKRGSLEESDSAYRQAQIETEKANYILKNLPNLHKEQSENQKKKLRETIKQNNKNLNPHQTIDEDFSIVSTEI